MADKQQFELLGLSFQELGALVQSLGGPAYRARQLYAAIYEQRQGDLSSITTLPLGFRDKLIGLGYSIALPAIEKKFASADGTIRYLLRFRDGVSVETVWMPEGDGGETGDGLAENEPPPSETPDWKGDRFHRATICVSSQAGCAVDCRFCMTALLGLQRNLSVGEIVGQVLVVLTERRASVAQDRINLVFMGQGEPFLNYENFMAAVRLLADEKGVGIPESRMTVSTSGIVPRILDFGNEKVRPKLAISLNASNDADRTQLMPINKKWDLGRLMAAARAFPLRRRERLTFEYVLLDHVNDAESNAREVVLLLHGLRAKVNLIALNPGPDIHFRTPAAARVLGFRHILTDGGVPAYIRKPRGRDIFAACGQLKRTIT